MLLKSKHAFWNVMSSLRKTGSRTGCEALIGLKMVGHQVEDGAAWAKLRGQAELLNPEFKTLRNLRLTFTFILSAANSVFRGTTG